VRANRTGRSVCCDCVQLVVSLVQKVARSHAKLQRARCEGRSTSTLARSSDLLAALLSLSLCSLVQVLFEMTLPDAFGIFCISLIASLVSEYLLYLTVYRRQSFRNDRDELIALQRKLHQEEHRIVRADRKPLHERRIASLERTLQETYARASRRKMWMNLAISIFYFFVYRAVHRTYSGRAVAALPFEPIPAVRRITHRDVPGDHPRETGLAFIYMLCSMTLRVFIGRVSGHDLPPVVARRLSK